MSSYPPALPRRSFLLGAGALVAFSLAGCGDDSNAETSPVASSAGPWEFTDDRGQKISLPQRPERVVGYVSTAAALWDFGVRPVGVFGPQKTSTGEKEIQAGNIDLATVESVGVVWDDFNVEKFASLKPDLVVTGLTGTKPTDLWAITEDIGKKVTQIAPIAAISEYKVSLPKVIERYSALAKALGADVDGATVTAAKADFEKASEELRTAAAAKAGLKVLVVYSDKDNVYVAKPEFFSDLAYYKELGIDLVAGEGPDDYWEKLSWEQVGKYPADLILTDTRTFSLPQSEMAKFPTWQQLPAVKAGQLGGWSAEPRFNYTLATPVLRSLTEAITRAKADVVA